MRTVVVTESGHQSSSREPVLPRDGSRTEATFAKITHSLLLTIVGSVTERETFPRGRSLELSKVPGSQWSGKGHCLWP